MAWIDRILPWTPHQLYRCGWFWPHRDCDREAISSVLLPNLCDCSPVNVQNSAELWHTDFLFDDNWIQIKRVFLLLDQLQERPGIPACSHILQSPALHRLQKHVSTNNWLQLSISHFDWRQAGLKSYCFWKKWNRIESHWVIYAFYKIVLFHMISCLKEKIDITCITYNL